MSIDYSLQLVYGQTLSSINKNSLDKMVSELLVPKEYKGVDLLTFGHEALGTEWSRRYPDLNVVNNNDSWSGQLQECLIVYGNSTYFNVLGSLQGGSKASMLPLRIVDLAVAVEEEAQLSQFCQDFGVVPAFSWTVVGSIS